MEADIATQSLGLASNTDFSLISLFLRADIIVKSVIIILILSSIYSWAIIFEHTPKNRIRTTIGMFRIIKNLRYLLP